MDKQDMLMRMSIGIHAAAKELESRGYEFEWRTYARRQALAQLCDWQKVVKSRNEIPNHLVKRTFENLITTNDEGELRFTPVGFANAMRIIQLIDDEQKQLRGTNADGRLERERQELES